MNKARSAWVIADSSSQISYLCSAAKVLATEHKLLVYCDQPPKMAAEEVYMIDSHETPTFVNCISVMCQLLGQEKPEIVLTSTSKNGRLAAGCLAAELNCAVFTDVSDMTVSDGHAAARRMVYGGAAYMTEEADRAVVCLGPGIIEDSPLPEVCKITRMSASESVKHIGMRAKERKKNNLSAAKRIVGVGRGVANEDILRQIYALSQQLNAEIGCTRPISEEQKWMPRETYIGVSGLMLKPELYIACGISGQIQHMVGVNQAKTVFAINKDKNAPIFGQCDYGLVGDLAQVVPSLAEHYKEN